MTSTVAATSAGGFDGDAGVRRYRGASGEGCGRGVEASHVVVVKF